MASGYMLLAGYSLECLTKGYLLTSRNNLKDASRLDHDLKTHDFTKRGQLLNGDLKVTVDALHRRAAEKLNDLLLPTAPPI